MKLNKFFLTKKRNNMKRIKFLVFAAAIVISGTIYSQDDNEPRFLLNNGTGKVGVSGFGAYTMGFSSFDGEFAMYNGGGGAVLLNQTAYFGFYGTGLSTTHSRDGFTMESHTGTLIDYDKVYTRFGHGGFWLGYIHKSYKPVHFGASTKLGWGSASLSDQTYNSYNSNNYDESYNYYSIVTDNVFVVQPQLEVELNLLKWFKINASAGYQFVTGFDKYYTNKQGNNVDFFDAKDFNQPVFNLTFAFGWFANKN